MKVFIQEIEELVVTDPAGLCNPPVPQPPFLPGIPIGQQPNIPIPMPMRPPSNPSPWQPIPQIPGSPTPWPVVIPPPRAPFYTKPYHDPNGPFVTRTRWGVGGPTIQQAGDALEQEKWEKNWQANQPEICQLSERSKRIMRGEDPDGN